MPGHSRETPPGNRVIMCNVISIKIWHTLLFSSFFEAMLPLSMVKSIWVFFALPLLSFAQFAFFTLQFFALFLETSNSLPVYSNPIKMANLSSRFTLQFSFLVYSFFNSSVNHDDSSRNSLAGLSPFKHSIARELFLCLRALATDWSNDCVEFNGSCVSVFILCMHICILLRWFGLEKETDPASDIPVSPRAGGVHFWLFVPWILYLWNILWSEYATVVLKLLLHCICSQKEAQA